MVGQYWNLSKSKFDEMDSLPLMNHPYPVFLISTVYLLFCLKIGPNYMKEKQPLQLKKILVAYNALQVFISGYLFYKLSSILWKHGMLPNTCTDDLSMRHEVISGIYLYFLAKISDLMDTVFAVLKKKARQISFLHVYHHCSMVICTFSVFKYSLNYVLVFLACLNSLVHVILYLYYGLSSLGPWIHKYLHWKRYITSLQLIQFVSMLIYYAVTMKYSKCPPSIAVAVFMMSNIAFMLVLFADFYKTNYGTISKKVQDIAKEKEINGKIHNAIKKGD